MEGHPSKQSKKQGTTESPIREPTGQYEKNPLFDDNNDSSNSDRQNEASSAQSSYAMGMDNTYSTYNYPTALESVAVYGQQNNHLSQEGAATNVHYNYNLPLSKKQSASAYTSNFLSGPMIIRVRPDGTPVEEDKMKPLPRDDDREAMTLGKNKIPTAQQIANSFGAPQRTVLYSNYRTDRRSYDHSTMSHH